MTPGQAVTVDGVAGTYVGQAWFHDDDGRRVEHDWVVVRRADGREVWVPPSAVSVAVAA